MGNSKNLFTRNNVLKNNILKNNTQKINILKVIKLNNSKNIFIILFISQLFFSFELYSQFINEEYLIENLKQLSSSEFKGRKPTQETFRTVQDYLVTKYKENGLNDITNNYEQIFDLPTHYSYDGSSSLSFNIIIPKLGVPIEKIKPRMNILTNGVDWSPMSMSNNGNFEGEIAFLGYGISAKDLKYDDYEGIDVNGKAVIILTDSPDGDKQDSKFKPFTRYSYKIKNAFEHGAKAVIFLKTQGDSANVFMPLEYFEYGEKKDILVLQGNRTTISKYFPNNAQLKIVEEKINTDKKTNSFILANSTVDIKLNLIVTYTQSSNIVGFIEGTDSKLKDEILLVGAHYDHLGEGAMNSLANSSYGKIHFGADDNASGTAAIISISKYFNENKPKRSLMFVLFTGEESGLLGSKYFVKSELMTKYNIVSMINVDMIGRYKDNILVGGVGTDKSFTDIVNKTNENYNFKLNLEQSGKAPSDSETFYLKNKPVLFFFTGIHEDYHTPRDTFDKIKKIEYVKITNMILEVIDKITNLENSLEFIKVD